MAITRLGAHLGWTHNLDDESLWTESYSGFGGGTPYARMAWQFGCVTPGFLDVDGQIGWGYNVTSSNGNLVPGYGATRNEDGLATPNRDRIMNVTDGPGLVNGSTNTVYRQRVESPAANGWSLDRSASGFPFPQSSAYIAMSWMGSMEAYRTQQILEATDGTVQAHSVGFTPDLIFSFGLAVGTVGFFINGHVLAHAITDCRTTGMITYGIHRAYENAAGDHPFQAVSSGFISYHPVNANSGTSTAYQCYRITSVDANGFHIECSTSTAAGSNYFQFFALKFNEAGTHFRVGTRRTGTDVASRHLQVNSVDPHFLYVIATDTGSYNYIHNVGETLSIGMYSKDDAVQCFGTITEEQGTDVNNATFVGTSNLANLFTINGDQKYRLTDPSMSANSITYIENGSLSTYGPLIFHYFVFGEGTNAATHIQQEDGTSIFLTNNEFGDDLLLFETAPAVTGISINRDFPLDDKRDLPLRVNSVRDYPVN